MPAQFDDAPDFSIRDVLDTLRRRKWVILQAFVFVSIIGGVTAALGQPIYSTHAKLLVETPGDTIVNRVDMTSSLGPLQLMRRHNNVETQLAILRSSAFRNKVDQRLKGRASGVSVSYSNEEKTTIVGIQCEGTDPKAIAEYANAAAEEYVRLTQESNTKAINATKKYLEAETEKAQTALAAAERRLLTFKGRTSLEESDEAHAIRVKEAVDLQARARDARTDLLSVTAKLADLQRRLIDEPEMLKESRIVPNPEVEVLRERIAALKAERAILRARYQPDSEKIVDVNDQIGALEEVLGGQKAFMREQTERPNPRRDSLEAELMQLKQQHAGLTATVASLSTASKLTTTRTAQIPTWQVELDRIQRERNMAEKTLLDFSEKLREVNVREKTIVASAQVLEKAYVPGAPVRPDKAQQVAMAMVMGLMLGIGFAFLQEFLDDRVNTSDDVERLTALPTIGTVPTIGDDHNRVLIGHDALSPLTESYRALRTSVQYSSIDRALRTLIVTSAHPGEGKSITSANLGIAMALQGKTVILVDTDLRRPSIHRLFRLEAEPGLTSVLAGEVTLEEALHETSIEGFRVLTCGPLPPNPPELLNSQAMMDLIEEMKGKADVVILDTPPTIPVTDSQVMASKVDGVILVVEAGQTRKHAVKHARDLLDQTHGRLLGVVLNKIEQGSKGYYYHYYYRGGYGKYGADKGRGGYGYGYGYGRRGPKLGSGDEAETVLAGGDQHEPGRLPERLRDWE